MPLYLVRWPHLRASIIRAEDEEHLKYIIDELDDPGGCTWSVYRGPLWIDFEVPVEFVPKFRDDKLPMAPDEFDLVGVQELAREFDTTVTTCESETVYEMKEAVLAKCFPAIAAALKNRDDDGGLDAAQLEAALRHDLTPLLQYDWRLKKGERETGPEADLKRQLGVSVSPTWLLPGEDSDGDE